jgi:hypothetical protein
MRRRGSIEIIDPVDFLIEDLAVKKDDRAECLALEV